MKNQVKQPNQDSAYRIVEKPDTIQFSNPYKAPEKTTSEPQQIKNQQNLTNPFAPPITGHNQ